MRRFLPLVLLTLACTHSALRVEPEEHERFDQPDAAAEFYAMKHAAPPGVDPHERYATARARMESMEHYSTAASRIEGHRRATTESTTVFTPWQFLGPGNIGGRTRALVFDPSNERTLYAGGISGGIWKSINGGESWTPIGDALANLDVSILVVDPSDPRTIYAGTGEGYFREEIRGTRLPLRGDGIFVTHDAGQSWMQLPETAANEDFHWINDLIMSPRDPHRLYAATRTGVWRSGDAGDSWKRVLSTTVKGGCTDLVARPDTADDTAFAACGVFEQATVYRNTKAQNDDSEWTAVLNETGMSRTSLAIAPSNPSIIYALSASNTPGPLNTTQNLQAVYRSDSGGAAGSWVAQVKSDDPDKLNRVLLSNPIAAIEPQCAGSQGLGDWVPMGWHCNVVAVDPTNPNRLWAAGVDVFRSDDGGKTWGVASYWWISNTDAGFVHADQHVIAFHPQYNGASNQTMFVANDGGIYRTDNATAATGRGTDGACRPATKVAWRPLNHNYGVTQFYHGAVFPDGKRFIGGAQDNGTVLGTIADGSDKWSMTWGGDGSFVGVDPVSPNFVYAQSQNGAVVRSDDGGKNFRPVPLVGSGGGNFLFIAPLAIDPSHHERVWVGGAQLWRTDNQAFTWAAVSTPTDGKVSAVAIDPRRSDHVIAGTESGAILRSEIATAATSFTAWQSSRPRDGFVSSIAFDPSNLNIVYATYAGFGGSHVWRSLDGGTTWTPRDDSLPDIPVHSIAIDTTIPGRLFLGTDLGVYVSLDSGASWMVESGLTPVLTEFVTIAQGEYGPAIYAFTHGRGAWRAALTPAFPRRRAAGH
jgi:hypothetical protein